MKLGKLVDFNKLPTRRRGRGILLDLTFICG